MTETVINASGGTCTATTSGIEKVKLDQPFEAGQAVDAASRCSLGQREILLDIGQVALLR